jgi:hypothetical protein
VLRGGSWNNNDDNNFRSANRNNNDPDNRNNNNGFRLASTFLLGINIFTEILRLLEQFSLISCPSLKVRANRKKFLSGW